jgi:hypothetical protein
MVERRLWRRWCGILAACWIAAVAGGAHAQARLDREGVTLYWGLVPTAVAARTHDPADLHGGPPKGGGQVHHLVVALYDSASGRRIEDAVVRAQLSEIAIVDGPPKYLAPMKVNDQASYGQVFGVAREGPYRFRVWVRLPQRQDEIEFAFAAWSPHRTER